MPRACKQYLRSTCSHCQIGHANFRSQIKNPRPMRSAIDRLVDSTLCVRSIGVPQRAGINADRAVLAKLLEKAEKERVEQRSPVGARELFAFLRQLLA